MRTRGFLSLTARTVDIPKGRPRGWISVKNDGLRYKARKGPLPLSGPCHARCRQVMHVWKRECAMTDRDATLMDFPPTGTSMARLLRSDWSLGVSASPAERGEVI